MARARNTPELPAALSEPARPAHIVGLEEIEDRMLRVAGAESNAQGRLLMIAARERSLTDERETAFKLKALGHPEANDIIDRTGADLAELVVDRERAAMERRAAVEAGADLRQERTKWIADHAREFIGDAEDLTEKAMQARAALQEAFNEAAAADGAARGAWSTVNTALGAISGGAGRPFHAIGPSPFDNVQFALAQLVVADSPKPRLASVEFVESESGERERRSSVFEWIVEEAA